MSKIIKADRFMKKRYKKCHWKMFTNHWLNNSAALEFTINCLNTCKSPAFHKEFTIY